ncbi:hypothetical protein BBP40_011364 [Aspergillus hancockii]|nr:hypothetical protein BBP40_011364 [Aspergillus hancockii]
MVVIASEHCRVGILVRPWIGARLHLVKQAHGIWSAFIQLYTRNPFWAIIENKQLGETNPPGPSWGQSSSREGNGFVAYHIIAKILAKKPECSIHSLDVNIDRNRHSNANVHYHHADIAVAADVERVMQTARPVTIFHTASPKFSDQPVSAYRRIIIDGTQHLLDAAVKVQSVRTLVNTSTSRAVNDNHTNLVDAASRSGGRDNRGVLTCVLHPYLAFGEHEVGALGKMVAAARQGRSQFQMGDGQNPYDFMYIGNLADAHLLVAHALLDAWGKPQPTDPNTRVDGEVFNISNDDPWLFWDFQRAVASRTGNLVRLEDIVTIPNGRFLFLSAASLARAETCYWPNGKPAPDNYHPWPNSKVCCAAGEACLSNGLCYGAKLNIAYRGACTDSSWPIADCTRVCYQDSGRMGEPLRMPEQYQPGIYLRRAWMGIQCL